MLLGRQCFGAQEEKSQTSAPLRDEASVAGGDESAMNLSGVGLFSEILVRQGRTSEKASLPCIFVFGRKLRLMRARQTAPYQGPGFAKTDIKLGSSRPFS
jgi:hypothetical protein